MGKTIENAMIDIGTIGTFVFVAYVLYKLVTENDDDSGIEESADESTTNNILTFRQSS